MNDRVDVIQSECRANIPTVTALESSFPALMLSEVGTKESWRKEIHRPATSTHKWWAKRLGTVFRGILTSAVIPEYGNAEESYKTARKLSELVVLDPFAGSGVTGVEIAKLGARGICFDINPVATLVQRQALQKWDGVALEKAYRDVERSCRKEVDRLHLSQDGRTVLYYFWVATIACPTCSKRIRLFDSTVFSKNAYPKKVPRAQIVCPLCLDIQEGRNDFISMKCSNGHTISQQGPVLRSQAVCQNGHITKIMDALGDSPPQFEMYAKLVVDNAGQKSYEPITDWDRDLYAECEGLLESLSAGAVVPTGTLEQGYNTTQAINWNFTKWRDFFNARQLYSLSLIATAVRDLPVHTAEREALVALFSGTLEFNNLFASFKGEGTGAVRHMFSHHTLKPERTPLEAHPWGTPFSSGSFSTLLKSRIYKALEYKSRPTDLTLENGEVQRVTGLSVPLEAKLYDNWRAFAESDVQSAYIATRNSAETDLPDSVVDLIVTDPPYMDNVHYAELADFFHAWLCNMEPFPSYPTNDTTRRSGEVQHAVPEEFGRAIGAVWKECGRVLKPGGLLAFTFHQARISGWVHLMDSLRSAGFCVTSIQPVKGEMSNSVVKSGSREPSNLDSIVVCRLIADGGISPYSSADEALQSATNRLLHLLRAGIDVGAGDIRSVVRGTLLAHHAASDVPLDQVVHEVDIRASLAVNELLNISSA